VLSAFYQVGLTGLGIVIIECGILCVFCVYTSSWSNLRVF